jgi:uncharacterized phage-like protein YoqJ
MGKNMPNNKQIIKIGVSGHRYLSKTPLITENLEKSIRKIINENPNKEIWLYSPLAKGADQLVAQITLKNYPKTKLIIPLPFEEQLYLDDFQDEDKKQYFQLKELAEKIFTIPNENQSKENQFFELGEFIVNNSDYLIFLWNGKVAQGQGGTGQIVEIAMNSKKKIVWIRANNDKPEFQELWEGDEPEGSMVYLNW